MREKATNQRSEPGRARYQPNKVVIDNSGQTRVDFPLGLYVSSPRNHVARQPARKVAVQLALSANPWRRRKGDGNQIIDQPAAGEIDGGGERT
jgi:hypothetical protein